MTNIGIDKILLTTQDFRVKNLSDIRIFGQNRNISQGGGALPIYTDLSNNKIEANSFYHNGEKAIYDISQKGLAIKFNPSKKLHPFNLVSSGDKLNEHLKGIDAELKKIGIVADIDAMKLSRFDLAKNESMEYPLVAYHSAFNLLKGKRSNTNKFPDSYYIGNKTHKTIFYDKQKELKYNKVEAITPPNFLRTEVRFLKTDGVKRYTTIQSTYDLKNIDASDIDAMYKSYLENVIFARSKMGNQMLIDFDNEIQIYNSLKQKMPKGYFNYWLQLNSIDALFSTFGSIDNVKMFLESAGENRMTIHRNINKLKEIISTRGFLSRGKKEVTPTSLLNEVRMKFVA